MYLARLTERIPGVDLAIDELCAVKVSRGEVASDIEHSRLLLAEGATATRFRHPVAVTVYEVDRIGAEPFTAMEYVTGQTLAALMLRESSQGTLLPPEVVALIGAEVAAALYAASQRAWSPSGTGPMIHGGLNPRSVLIDYDGNVRLLGLGAGRARMHLPQPRSRLAYLAPELWSGRPPDRRTDLFALGAILHDAFTGQRLFRRTSDSETRSAILTDPLPNVAQALSMTTPEVAKLVASMLERQLDKRPRDAEEVEEALRPVAGDRERAKAILAARLERGFREDREAQRRVVEAALRRGPSAAKPAPEPAKESPRAEVVSLRRGSSVRSPVREPEPDEPPKEPDTVVGLRPRSGASPEPRRPAGRGGSQLSELLPELMSGDEPLLSERDIDTVDLPTRGPPVPNSQIAAIPLTQRTAKPEPSAALAEEETLEGAIGGEPRPLPEWSATAAPTPSGVRLAEAEGSLSEVLDRATGAAVARYRRSTLLGLSELASVYLASDAVLGRTVALKVSDIGDDSKARFDRDLRIKILRREARLAAGLYHPRLPALLDAGRDGDVYFLAYQLVEGTTLDRVVAERGPVPAPLVRLVLRDVSDALAYLHQQGMTHADISAANVLIEPDGHARLVDFSMLAAEQQPHPLGAEPDVPSEMLALGQLGLWMLAGGPRAVDPTELDPELAVLLARLVEPDPTRRWIDAAELREALDELLDAVKRRPAHAPERPPSASPLDAKERPGAPLGVGPEALALSLESVLRRAKGFDAPDRDPSGPLARAVGRRLGLAPEAEGVAAVLLAARSTLARTQLKARAAVAEGLLAPVLGARLLELEERSTGQRSPEPTPDAIEVAAVVDAYVQSTTGAEAARRVSPRRAVLALRERADEGRFDGRVVEALIDHLRTTISALEIPPRERLLLVGLEPDGPLALALAARGHPLVHAADAEAAIASMASTKPWGAVLSKRAARRAAERLPAGVCAVALTGSLEDTLDEGMPPLGSVELVPANASAEQVLAALRKHASA